MDFHVPQYINEKWGRVYLGNYHGPWAMNQRFEYNGEELFVKETDLNGIPNLVLDVYGSQDKNGAKVGFFKRHGTDNQKW